jgi:hypothetical protein
VNRGVGVSPLACCAARPGFLGRGRGAGWPYGVGMRTWSGWSGCGGGGSAGGVPEAEPFVLAVPVFGQVEDEVSSAVFCAMAAMASHAAFALKEPAGERRGRRTSPRRPARRRRGRGAGLRPG